MSQILSNVRLEKKKAFYMISDVLKDNDLQLVGIIKK